jgi:site-specific DNA-methyltransferase (adenine-specific)/adenine-specific DNA-methyltransferase
MIDINRIHQGDAFDLLGGVDDGAIDLAMCDGPYGMTSNQWDRVGNIQKFNLDLIRIFPAKLKDGGALYLFGKQDCIDFIDYRPHLTLRSRIIWYQPSRLGQGKISYTNNYDVICYFIKGERPRTFDLDAVRIPQLVELEHRLRCERVPSVAGGKFLCWSGADAQASVPSVAGGKFGKTKFNPKGKNPGDVWGDIKQLTYKSKELVSRNALNTIQKPEKLIERLVKASSQEDDLVLDPFAGVGTCPVVCRRLGRRFIGIEQDKTFVPAANSRLKDLESHLTGRLL